MLQRFEDRRQAGKMLAEKLMPFAGRDDVIVLALPRGGVPVAFEVAFALQVPLDVLVVRKLGAPGNGEFAFGAIAVGGICLVDEAAVKALGVSDLALDQVIRRETKELARREELYRGNRHSLDLSGKTVIIVDDGLATGLTMRAALAAIRRSDPKEIVIAVPVCAPITCEELQNEEGTWCVCVQAPEPFHAVGLWYRNFDQTSDEQVRMLLSKAESASMALFAEEESQAEKIQKMALSIC